jgi:DNA-binding MarR family transcriptional regulator
MSPPNHGPFDSLGFRLFHGALRWQRELAQQLAPLELTPAQFAVLGAIFWLTRNRTAPSQIDISRQAGFDPAMTSRLIKTLVSAGFVVRSDDPADSRAFRVTLSVEGRARASAAIKLVKKAEAKFFAELDEDPQVLGGVLWKIAFGNRPKSELPELRHSAGEKHPGVSR